MSDVNQQPWTGLKYHPVAAIFNRLSRRRARTERKNFLRFLRQSGDSTMQRELYLRVAEIRKDPKLGAAQKNNAFARVLERYAAHVTNKRKELEEADARATS
jgi:hypothetical protein